MSQSFGWKPGPLIVGGSSESSASADRGGPAEQFVKHELDKLGFTIKPDTPDPGVDIVAIDKNEREIAIDVKTPRRQKEGRLFVTNARAPVAIHLFVDPRAETVWAVPADVVRERGDVLKEDDVSDFEGWDALKGWDPDH